MKSRKLTLRKEMLLGLSLLLILAGVFEFVGHLQMQSLARKAAYARQINRCEKLFEAVDQRNQIDSKTGQVSSEWKKAKDSFVTAVAGLSKVSSANASEKACVADIQKAWQGYESTLQHRSAAGAVAVRSVIEGTMSKAEKAAQGNLKNTLAATDFGLRVAVLLGSLIGAGIVLVIARDIRSRFNEIRHQLEVVTNSQSVRAQTKVAGEDELKAQAEQLKNAVAELNEYIGQNIVKNVTIENEQLQEEKISNN
jgi:hypothetical protein